MHDNQNLVWMDLTTSLHRNLPLLGFFPVLTPTPAGWERSHPNQQCPGSSCSELYAGGHGRETLSHEDAQEGEGQSPASPQRPQTSAFPSPAPVHILGCFHMNPTITPSPNHLLFTHMQRAGDGSAAPHCMKTRMARKPQIWAVWCSTTTMSTCLMLYKPPNHPFLPQHRATAPFSWTARGDTSPGSIPTALWGQHPQEFTPIAFGMIRQRLLLGVALLYFLLDRSKWGRPP